MNIVTTLPSHSLWPMLFSATRVQPAARAC
jgi:hypothetical protein